MKTGDKLPNGAIVIEESNGVILAKTPRVFRDFPKEYVTWRWDGSHPDSTMYGNYFYSIAEAAKDFEGRVEAQRAA